MRRALSAAVVRRHGRTAPVFPSRLRSRPSTSAAAAGEEEDQELVHLPEGKERALKWLDELDDVQVIPNAISHEAHDALVEELEGWLKRRRYIADHWDSVIIDYREIERPNDGGWSEQNRSTLAILRDRLASCARHPLRAPWMPTTHVIDLAKDGFIKPHVDSTKFSGDVVCGLSLLSTSVMQLCPESEEGGEENKPSDAQACVVAQMLLPPRSVYMLQGAARYKLTHEILPSRGESLVKWHTGACYERQRRISLIFRDAKAP